MKFDNACIYIRLILNPNLFKLTNKKKKEFIICNDYYHIHAH